MKLLKNKLTVTIIVLSVAFLGLITLTVSRDDKGLESGAGSTLNPVQKVAYGFNRGVKDFVDFFLNFSDVRDENKELKKENDMKECDYLVYVITPKQKGFSSIASAVDYSNKVPKKVIFCILKEYEKISCKIVLNFVKAESKFMLY